MAAVHAIKLKAPSTPSGNPRRVFVVFHAEGDIADAIDEGYSGTDDLYEVYPELKGKAIPEFNVPVKEYNDLMRRF